MKSKQSWMGRQSKRVLTGIMSLAAIVGTTALAQAPAPEPAAKQKTRQQGTDQRAAQHLQRQKETGGTGIRARHWVYPVCGNGVRGVQNSEEGRFLAGTGGSGKTTGPRSKPRNRESAGKSNHGQELVGASGCAGGYLAARRSLAGFRDCDGFG